MKDKTEIPHIIDINIKNMNKFLFLIVVVAIAVPTTIQAYAQTAPPPLGGEANDNKPSTLLSAGATTTETDEKPTTTSSLGKIIIQISQTEQIVLDLPLKSENKYQVAPIK